MNLDFNVLVFLTGFIFALPVIGYLFRFNIPISIFFLLAGTFMIAIFLATDGIILNDRIDNVVATPATFNLTSSVNTIPNYSYNVLSSSISVPLDGGGTNPRLRVEFASSSSSALVGDVIECINIALQDTGTPSIGIAEIGTFDTAGNIVKQFGSINALYIGNLSKDGYI